MKSPPELWAEISDPEAMAKHLGEFGEIRITRVEPEHTVAWEGELAKGTARIESSGWGTKVVLTAEIPQPEPEIPEPPPEPEPAPPPEPEPAPPPEPAAPPPPVPVEPDAAAMEPQAPKLEHDEERMSLLARLFGVRWSKRPELQHLVEQLEPEPTPEPEDAEAVDAEVEPPQPEPEPEPEPDREPEPEPQPSPEPEPAEPAVAEVPALDPERARAVLDGTLEALGAAHHRPFSRA